MKAVYLSILLLLPLDKARAQGTIYFNAHLTGNTPYTGDGTFSLETATNYFSYDVVTVFGFSQGEIHSPWPDTNAPVLFNLSLIGCNAPAQGDAGSCEFRGHFTLTDQQAADLANEQWFVVLPGGMATLRGQILTVPEPSSFAIGTLGALAIGLYGFTTWSRLLT